MVVTILKFTQAKDGCDIPTLRKNHSIVSTYIFLKVFLVYLKESCFSFFPVKLKFHFTLFDMKTHQYIKYKMKTHQYIKYKKTLKNSRISSPILNLYLFFRTQNY